MWWVFIISLITIPIFLYFDNKQYAEQDLAVLENLILSEDSYKDPGAGKSHPPSIKLNFKNTRRGFQINYEEYQCISIVDILTNFKKGDTVLIKLTKSDKAKFHKKTFFSKYSKIYGLAKEGKEYINLGCRNKVSTKRTTAATVASGVTAVLSLFLALVVLKPKTKYQAIGQLPVDPMFIIILAWLIVCLALR